MHLTEGQLRAYLDAELDPSGLEKAGEHLADCQECRELLAALAQRAGFTGERLDLLAPSPAAFPAGAASARMATYLATKENKTMLQKIFARPYRPAWVALGVVLLLAIALAFPPVQAIANSFLGLFRVQQITVVQVNPGNLPEQLGRSSQLEYLLAQNVQVQDEGEILTASSVAEASQLAGFPVRLPTALKGQQLLRVQPGATLTFQIDLERVQGILEEVGRGDIQIPPELDGETVTVQVPKAVAAYFGPCEAITTGKVEEGYDPDQENMPRLGDCTTFIQMLSPDIQAPAGLDVAAVGKAFLELMGMTDEEAAHFAEKIDWTTTFVVPIPRYGTSYEDVLVDGVEGTLIRQHLEDHLPQYLLLWVKDGILYALTGQGGRAAAMNIAASVR